MMRCAVALYEETLTDASKDWKGKTDEVGVNFR